MIRRIVAALLLTYCTGLGAAEIGQLFIEDFGSVRLLDTQGECPSIAREVHLRKTDGKTFGGCWLLRYDTIFILWDDGDRDMVPATSFKWREA